MGSPIQRAAVAEAASCQYNRGATGPCPLDILQEQITNDPLHREHSKHPESMVAVNQQWSFPNEAVIFPKGRFKLNESTGIEKVLIRTVKLLRGRVCTWRGGKRVKPLAKWEFCIWEWSWGPLGERGGFNEGEGTEKEVTCCQCTELRRVRYPLIMQRLKSRGLSQSFSWSQEIIKVSGSRRAFLCSKEMPWNPEEGEAELAASKQVE